MRRTTIRQRLSPQSGPRQTVGRKYNIFGESDEPWQSDVAPGTMGTSEDVGKEDEPDEQ